MKKKGLIISTVVMVVVLIASLTTATYAWFSSSAAATVSNISLNVGAASSVQIGVGTGTSATTYHYGDVTYTKDGGWTGSNQGLGTSINTNLLMDVTAGVGSGTGSSSADWAMDESYNSANKLLKAKGDFPDGSVDGLDIVGDAIINGAVSSGTPDGKTDVVDLAMGIKIAQENVYGTYGKITITPTGEFVGMAAALHFEITVGTGENAKSYVSDVKGLLGEDVKFDDPTPANPFVFYFMINEKQETAYVLKDATITQFTIKFFVLGYDTDCCNDATGTGATISLEFAGCETAAEPTDAGTKITLE